MHKIANKLHQLHESLKCVHLDLKPQNIIINHTAKGGYEVTIIDLDSLRPIDGKTRTRGTEDFIAPEITRFHSSKSNNRPNAMKVDPAMDMYSFGKTFAALLAVSDRQQELNLLITELTDQRAFRRPSIAQVCNVLKDMKDQVANSPQSAASPAKNAPNDTPFSFFPVPSATQPESFVCSPHNSSPLSSPVKKGPLNTRTNSPGKTGERVSLKRTYNDTENMGRAKRTNLEGMSTVPRSLNR